ncbi:MAG: hypothetical protein PHE09_02470 [Oscillospiraceae bacterium]|nr:hypothetical protein [Oscillospiraceae bacterium]
MKTSILDIPLSAWTLAQCFEFIITYLIPIVTCLTLILGGFWTLYKYFKDKNRDFYSSILEKVYAPLFEELVKMEYSRKLLINAAKSKEEKKSFKVKEEPFISWSGEHTDTKMENGKTTVRRVEYNVFNFDDRLRQIHDDEGRLKYAPRDLVSLIRTYFFLEQVKGVPSYQHEKFKIQKHIRRNVIIGYKNYRKKLGLRDVSIFKFCYSWYGFIWFK